MKFEKICDFQVLQLLLGDWLQIGHQVMRKIVLYTVSFAYSLLLSSLLVFTLLSY